MKRAALIATPTVLGIALASFWQSDLAPNPILYLKSDIGTLLFIVGLLVSLVIGVWLFIQTRAQKNERATLVQYEQAHADAHRRFVQRLDHEIKNPLTAIRAGLANLNGETNVPTLSSVRAQVNRLARLTADLRKLADLETQPIERGIVNLGELLDEIYEYARERAESKQCHLRMAVPQAPWPLPPISGDRDLLLLALHNLIDNALKFSQEGDTIEIRAYEDGPSVTVQIADTGPGVSDDDLPHLGEELYRGSTARGIEGSGLGLALVNAIVARHQGTVTIRSRLNQGTVVSIRLPVTR